MLTLKMDLNFKAQSLIFLRLAQTEQEDRKYGLKVIRLKRQGCKN